MIAMRIDVRLSQEAILKALTDEKLTYKEIAERVGCSIRTAQRHVYALQAQGIITSKHTYRGKVYVINQ
jgi:transposase